MYEPHWTAYVSSFLTPIIAVVGILIAYRQWRTARDKLKHELFDRRYAIFEAVRDLCEFIFVEERPKNFDSSRVRFAALEARWLFNDDVSKYITALNEKFVELAIATMILDEYIEKYPLSRYLSTSLSEVPETDRKDILEKRRIKNELIEWFSNQDSVFDEKFGPFLTLAH